MYLVPKENTHMSENTPVIVGAVRTPTGKFLSNLASFTAPQLGAIVIKEAVRRSGISPDSIDEIIMGNVVSAGVGQSPARQAAIHAELPDDIPAFTVNKVCGSGLKAVMLAAQAIRAGDAQAFVAGGMESMSNAPYLLTKVRTGYRMGDGKLVDAVVHDGLWCAFENIHMGSEAEIIAEKFGITPRYIFAAPTRAVNRLLQRTGLKINDFDLIEVNEAFAAQTLANGKELDWDWSRVNVNGGAIALGHPIGSSGSRVLTTLIYELRRRGGGRGLATLCLGGGGAVAMSVEA